MAVVSEGGRPSTNIIGVVVCPYRGQAVEFYSLNILENRVQRKIFPDKIAVFFHGIQFFSCFVYNEGFCFSVYRYQLMQAFMYSCV